MDTVIVGKIGAPYGVRGWVKIHSFTQPLTNLFTYPLLLESKSDWREIAVEEYKPHGDGFIAKLAEIDDRDKAALITNLQLAVKREDLPELADDEYYFNDLIGLEVYNKENIELGKVVDYFATGANDVLVVKGVKEHLIPFIPDMYIISVDLPGGKMQVDWDAEF